MAENNDIQSESQDTGEATGGPAPNAVAEEFSLKDTASAVAAFATQDHSEASAAASAAAEELRPAGEEQATAAEDQGDESSNGPADGAFQPSDKQVELAKQLGMTDDEIVNMTESQAFAIDMVARKDSRRQSEAGREDGEEEPAGEESSAGADDDKAFFTEDDWGTAEGAKKLSELHAALQSNNNNPDLESVRVTTDEFFSSLDPEVFADFEPAATSIQPGSVADQKRTIVVEMAASIRQTFAKQGVRMTEAQAMERALSTVSPDEMTTVAGKRLRAAASKRNKQVIQPPSGRQSGGRHFANAEEKAGHAAATELAGA